MSIPSERLPDHNPQWLFDIQNKKLQKAYEKNSRPKLAKLVATLSPLAKKVNETSILHHFIKVIKYSTECVIIFSEKLKAKEIYKYCSTFSNTIKSFGLINGIRTIIENSSIQELKDIKFHERNLGISYGFFNTISGGLSFINLLDQFKLIEIANISLSLGPITLIPFQLACDGIELIKTGIEIATGCLRIYETSEKRSKIQIKKTQFSTKKSGNITAFLNHHIQEIKEKQTTTLTTICALELHSKETYKLTEKAFQNYKKAKSDHKINRSLSAWLKCTQAKSILFANKNKHDKVLNKCENLRSKFEARTLKWKVWTALENHHTALLDDQHHKDPSHLTFDPNDPLARLLEHKKEKWKKQLNNCSWLTAIDAVGISLQTVISTTIVASSALALTGIGTAPALIAMAASLPLASFGNLALELLKDYKSPYDIPKTDFNTYKPNPIKLGYSIYPDRDNKVFI